MPTETVQARADQTAEPTSGKRQLTPAAQRALAEAAARRAERDRDRDAARSSREEGAKEKAGRGGLDPTRYGDWEVNGLASDF